MDSTLLSLKNKVAFVSGGSRGIGLAIAQKLSMLGVEVTISATNEANAKRAQASLKEQGLDVHAVWGDISVAENSQKMIDDTFNRRGKLDFLINNAGITRDNLLLRMSEIEWQDIMNTNLNGTFFLTKAAIKYMVKQKYGRIVNISSVVGFTGNAGQVNYSTSKSALIGFTKSIAKELASRNITCNLIAPGFIETDMTKNLASNVKDAIIGSIAMKKMGKGEDIANGVVFLCSDMADYITGTSIHINGGLF